MMNRLAKDGARSSRHMAAMAFLLNRRTKVFANGTVQKIWT